MESTHAKTFKEVLAKQQANKTKLREKSERQRKDLEARAVQVSGMLMDNANTEVGLVWKHEVEIEAQIKQLQLECKRFNKQTAQWIGLYNTFNDALKEVGDVENWLGTIEKDMKFVSEGVIAASKTSTERQLKQIEKDAKRLLGNDVAQKQSGQTNNHPQTQHQHQQQATDATQALVETGNGTTNVV